MSSSTVPTSSSLSSASSVLTAPPSAVAKLVIDDVTVSLGGALPDKTFRKINTSSGGALDLSGGSAVFLWASSVDAISAEEAVISFAILYDDEEPEPGFKRIARDLSGGAGSRRSYLAVCKAPLTPDSRPITNVALLAPGDEPEFGYEVLQRSLIAPSLSSNQESYAPLFRLAFQSVIYDELTGGQGGANLDWLDAVKVGISLDALAADKSWRVAKVVSLRSIEAENSSSASARIVRVTFKGWGSTYDEDLPQSLKRLARLGTHTAGKDTRRNAKQGESFRVDMDILASLEAKIDMLLDGSFPADERDTFARGELPEYVLEVMSSKYDDTDTISAEDLRNRINQFNKKVLSLCVHHIDAVNVPIPPEVLQHLQRYFLMDERCNFFYSYGHLYHFDADAANYIDKAAGFPAVNKASKYWVANVNAFWKLGGMEAVLKRYKAHTVSANQASSAISMSHSVSGDAAGGVLSSAWSDPGASNELMIVIKAVCMGRWCFTRYWGEKYFAQLRDCVLHRLQSLSDVQLKKISVAEIDGIRTAFLETAKVQTERYGVFDDQLAHRRILMGPQATLEDPVEPFHYEFDRLGLPFWVKLLAIDSLTLRVKAVTELNDIYRVALLSMDQKAPLSGTHSRGTRVKPLFTFDFLFKFTRDHRVINLLLGEIEPGHPNSQVHAQILSRIGAKDGVLEASAYAANIISRDNLHTQLDLGLTRRHLDLLWNIFLEARGDDVVRHAVLEILESLAPRLTPEYHIQIFKHFSLFPMTEFDVPMVRIVAVLTRHAVSTAGSSALLSTSTLLGASADEGGTTLTFGLHLLWNMSCVDVDESDGQGSAPSKVVVDAAQTLLLDLLQKLDPKRALVRSYVQRAAAVLVRGEANIQHVRMLNLMLARLESASTASGSSSLDMSSTVAQDLVSRNNICEALVRDVQTYKERAINANKKKKLEAVAEIPPLTDTVYYGRYSHSENLSERLQLLSTLSVKSQVGLSSEQVSTLWTALIDSAMNASERETFYNWLQSALRPDDQQCARFISSKDIQTVFVAHFMNRKQPWDVKNLGVRGLSCFKTFLEESNSESKSLTIIGNDMALNRMAEYAGMSSHAVLLEKSTFLGLETLWNIILSASDELVSNEAAQYLVNLLLFTNLPIVDPENQDSLSKSARGLWTTFASTCMLRLENSFQASPDSSFSSRAAGRIIRLLLNFLSSVKKLRDHFDAPLYKRVTDPETFFLLAEEGIPIFNSICIEPLIIIQRVTTRILKMPLVVDDYNNNQYQHVQSTLYVRIRKGCETIGDLRDRLADYINCDPRLLAVYTCNNGSAKTISTRAEYQVLQSQIDNLHCEQLHQSSKQEEAVRAEISSHVPIDRNGRIRRSLERFSDVLKKEGYELPDIVYSPHYFKQAREAYSLSFEAPQMLLSDSPKHFEALFRLLRVSVSVNPSLVQDIWKLIEFIPRARAKVDMIHSMNGLFNEGDEIRHRENEVSLASSSSSSSSDLLQLAAKVSAPPSWEEILGGKSPFEFLYSLQILNAKLEIEGASVKRSNASPRDAKSLKTTNAASTVKSPLLHNSGSNDVQSLWGRAFARRGGVEYLYSKVMQINLQELFASSKSDNNGAWLLAQCAALLLKIFARFILTPTFGLRSFDSWRGSKPFNFSVDRSALALRLLEWIAFASTASLPRVEYSEGETLNAETPTKIASVGVSTQPYNSVSPPGQKMLSFESEVLQASVEIIAICLSGADEPMSSRLIDHSDERFSSLCPQLDVLSAVYTSLRNNDVIATALCSSALDIGARETLSESLESAWIISAAAEKNKSLPPSVPSLHKFFLASFLLNIRLLYAFPNTCSQFVEVVANKLLPLNIEQSSSSLNDDSLPIDGVKLLSDLSQMIRSHPVVEIGSDSRDVHDRVLSGLLVITRNVLIGRPSLRSLAGAPVEEGGFGLLHEVFSQCLFSFLDISTTSVDQISGTESNMHHPLSVLGGKLPKCKQTATREAALDLLSELVKGDSRNCLALAREFLPHHDALAANELLVAPGSLMAGNSADFFDTDAKLSTVTTTLARLSAPRLISSDETATTASARSQRATLHPRSSTGFVGLRNLGCICYMNATLQQFYMNHSFRAAVLSHRETGTSEAEKADSIMYQLQRQFAYLQESEKSFFTPTALCSAIKDWEGRPTDYFEQKDVPEFLTKMFTDMESQLQGTRLATIAKDVYGLTTIQELVADNPRGIDRPRFYSASDVATYFVNLPVKGFKSLAESLTNFTEGEQVDYTWELPVEDGGGGGGGGEKSKESKVSLKTMKRNSIKSTGDCLMLHLNRFEFDLNHMEQVKINDRFEFPAHLDLYPYTMYGRSAPAPSQSDSNSSAAFNSNGDVVNVDASSFMYELVGVVIHMGTPAGGHYISYARERRPSGPVPSDSWFEFNDSVVSPWAGLDRLDEDCFGGVERSTSTKNGPQPWTSFEKPKTANAFCLFYDRIRPGTRSLSSSVAGQTTTVFSLPRVEILSGKPPRVLLPKDILESFSQQLRLVHGNGRENIRAELRAPIPPAMLATIKRENLSFWRHVYTQQPAYTACMKSLISSYIQATPPRQKAATYPWKPIINLSDAIERGGEGLIVARLMWSFGLNTIQESISPDPSVPDDWIDNVGNLFSSNLVASAWLLTDVLADGGDTLRKVLLLGSDQGPAARTRTFVSKILCAVINAVWPVELRGPQTEREQFDVAEARSLHQSTGRLVLDLIDVLIQQMQDAHKHYRNFNSMFEILHCFSRASDASRQYLLEARMIGRICDLLVTGHSPDPTVNAAPWPSLRGDEVYDTAENQNARREDTRSNLDSITRSDAVYYFNMPIWLLHDLVRGSLPLGASAGQPRLRQMSPFQLQPAQPLNDIDRRLLTSFVLAESLFNNRHFLYTNSSTIPGRSENETFLLDAIAPIYAHLMWDIDPPDRLSPSMAASPVASSSPRVSSKVSKRAELEVEGYASWHGRDAPEVTSNADELSHPSVSAISVISAGEGNLIGILTAVARQMLREDFEHFIRAPFLVARIIGHNAVIPTKSHPLAAPMVEKWPLPHRILQPFDERNKSFLEHSFRCVSFVLHHLAVEMKAQSRFFAETIRSTEHLIYLARTDFLVRTWCQTAGVEDLRWLQPWFLQNSVLVNNFTLKYQSSAVSPILLGKVKDASFSHRSYHALDPDLFDNVKRLCSPRQKILCRFIDIEEESADDNRLSKFVGRLVKIVTTKGVQEGIIEAVEARTHNSNLELDFRIQRTDPATSKTHVVEITVPGGQRGMSYATAIPELQYLIVDEDAAAEQAAHDDREEEPGEEEEGEEEEEEERHEVVENDDYAQESKYHYQGNYSNGKVGQFSEDGLTIRRPNDQGNDQQQASNNTVFKGIGSQGRTHTEIPIPGFSTKVNDTKRAADQAYQRVSNRDIHETDIDSDVSDRAIDEDDYDDDDDDDDNNDNDAAFSEVEDDENLRKALQLSSEEAAVKASLALTPPILPSDPPAHPR